MSEQQLVYFIRAGADGPIKIGKAVDPSARLKELQTASHERLTLLATTPYLSESGLHNIFQRDMIRGEWFLPTTTLVALIDYISDTSKVEKHHLEKRRHVWFVVLDVPEPLRAIVGKSRLIRTTGAKTLTEARHVRDGGMLAEMQASLLKAKRRKADA